MPGLHHVEFVMGMAVSIDVRDDVDDSALSEVLAWLHHVDATFSTHDPNTVISRIGRGELAIADAGDEVAGVLDLCEIVRERTGGAFDITVVPAPNGTRFDPSGLVKGWSIEHAAGILEGHGARNFSINGGGDIVVRGAPEGHLGWRVGIRHPDDASALAGVLIVPGPHAVATSATYERGAHIIDPSTGEPIAELASVTVVGPDLTFVDGYATAVFVMGVAGLDWIAGLDGYGAMVITRDDRMLSTRHFDDLRLR